MRTEETLVKFPGTCPAPQLFGQSLPVNDPAEFRANFYATIPTRYNGRWHYPTFANPRHGDTPQGKDGCNVSWVGMPSLFESGILNVACVPFPPTPSEFILYFDFDNLSSRSSLHPTASMGAGTTPLNIFKLSRGDDPKEVLNWRLWLATFSFGIMGAARGVDEGLISGTLASSNFRDLLNLPDVESAEYADIKATIASMVQIGSVAGAGL